MKEVNMNEMTVGGKLPENSEVPIETAEKEFIDGFSGFEPIPDQDLKKVLGGQEFIVRDDWF